MGGNRTPVSGVQGTFNATTQTGTKPWLPAKGYEGQVTPPPTFYPDDMWSSGGPSVAAPDKPQALSSWYATVVAVDAAVNPTAAQVRLAGDVGAIWAPLEVAGVTVGARVVVAFRADGNLAVVTVAQE